MRGVATGLAIGAAGLGVVVAAACYKGEAPEPPPLPTAGAPGASGAPGSASASATAVLPRAVPSGGAAARTVLSDEPPNPEAVKVLREELAKPAIPFDPGAPPKVTLRGLANTALGDARGLVPDGPPLMARLKTGQRSVMSVTLAPRGCTTFIAQGGLGVAEVDLFLAQGGASDLQLLAEDGRGGPIAVIGGKEGCLVNPREAPIVCDLHVSLRRGEGVVLVRGFHREGATIAGAAPVATVVK